jgi:hypothetical protein
MGKESRGGGRGECVFKCSSQHLSECTVQAETCPMQMNFFSTFQVTSWQP